MVVSNFYECVQATQRENAGLAIERSRVRIPFATISKFGTVTSLHDTPSSLSCINESLPSIDGGGDVNYSLRAWLECFPEKLSSCRNEQVCQG